MSSLVDTLLHSDDVHSDLAPLAHSDGPAPPQRRRQPRSSSRPRGPPSESAGARSDNEGFPDDEVVGARVRRRTVGPRPDVPRVVDEIGETIALRFQEFLETYAEEVDPTDTPAGTGPADEKYYVAQVHGMREHDLSTLYIDFTHLMSHETGVLAQAILDDYYRYMPFLTRALHNLVAKYEPTYYKKHRQAESASRTRSRVASPGSDEEDEEDQNRTPGKNIYQPTDKLFVCAFYNLPLVSRIRSLRTSAIGRLSSISGTVTRTSEVRPELHLATFICEGCNSVIKDVEQTFRYTEPTQCPNLNCGNRFGWRLDIRQSTFVDWQKVRIQENSAEIPTGSMPRTMDVILHGEIVDRAKAGEKCIFTGTLIVIPDVSQFRMPGERVQATRDHSNMPRGGDAGGTGVSGLKALGVRDLTYRLAFLACMVIPDTSTPGQSVNQRRNGQAANILASLKQTAPKDPMDADIELVQKEYLESLSTAEIDDLRAMVHSPNIYSRLTNSLAPMVYGHEVVKKGLLLQLMGGVSKVTPEGMALRGDINICIVGDPSTSKSQFLKYICSFLPRAVYTSGKASSAAGLTAAVIKDEETGDHTIEAGALMLADNGICAIDEFDKMDIADQVAIHEAMEQQTISIAKAGIQATLNARTSILAAANPVGGRYNRKTTLRANINMSAPIMSRFDLFFVILDECNENVDRNLARHIVNIHRLRDDAVTPEFSTEQLQRYIRFARTFKPEFTPEAKAELVQRYMELRRDDAQGGAAGRNSYRITVRQLESLVRLSEAIAKANCTPDISSEYVREAFDLLRQSIISVERDDVDVDDEEEGVAQRAGTRRDGEGEGEDAVMADDGGQDGRAASATTAGEQAQQPPGSSRQKTKITFDKYMHILNTLVSRISAQESSAATTADADDLINDDGIEEENLLLWYLERLEEKGEIGTEEDLERERSLARKVLRRMERENVVLCIRGEGLLGDGGDGEESGGEGRRGERRMYVLHPNYAVDGL